MQRPRASDAAARRRAAAAVVLFAVCAAGATIAAQGQPPASPAAASPDDPLGRTTPRGTVLGFMRAAARGEADAVQYLDTSLRDREAADLARQLFVVLDRRLSPRLGELSDRPEGSLAHPLRPDRDVVGTILVDAGALEVAVDRVAHSGAAPVWLFSRTTLQAIPAAYAEIDRVPVDRWLPPFLTRPRMAGIRLFQWLALPLFVFVVYRGIGSIGRTMGALAGWRRARAHADAAPIDLAPGPVRLLLTAVALRWVSAGIELPLLERLFLSGVAAFLVIAGGVWALLLLNGAAERSLYRRMQTAGRGDAAAMLRLGRRVADTLAVAAGVIILLSVAGIDPTAALAGLGIGGIAVALAAQKTLENVIGGLSIVFDQAVRVGDSIRLGDASGTVDDIGLRSTRIRTPDRTVLSVPNGQIANATIETLSARDKYWFHHIVGLRYETSAAQLHGVVNDMRAYLEAHPMVDRREAVRVRFLRFGSHSLDVELSAYLAVAGWEAFLETQQELLLEMMNIIGRDGTALALPSQIMHLADGRPDVPGAGSTPAARAARVDRHPEAELA